MEWAQLYQTRPSGQSNQISSLTYQVTPTSNHRDSAYDGDSSCFVNGCAEMVRVQPQHRLEMLSCLRFIAETQRAKRQQIQAVNPIVEVQILIIQATKSGRDTAK
jgi:hypothetical protein